MTINETPALPLADIEVLDLSPLLPGPFCGQLLANLGANVIRLEPPGGDWTRSVPNDAFVVANRGKRSLVLDLKEPRAQKALAKVAAGVDVVLEGFRPGVARRLGADRATLSADNPGLVYCSISGFGQAGPDAQRPGHDVVYLAAGGALDYSGHWGAPAARAGVPASDLAAANYAAIAILAALHERAVTGAGCHLDVSLTDVALSLASVRAGSQLAIRGETNLHLFPTNDLFEAADGVVLAIAAVEENFWRGLREVISTWCGGRVPPSRRRSGSTS
jgi:CoA:oxalate CoA-transferase